MRLRTIVSAALLLAVTGLTAAACSGAKPDSNPFGFVDSRRDD